MNPERWQRIDALVSAALERPEEERTSFLERACEGDEELCRQVQRLLSSHEAAGSFLESPPAAAAEALGFGTQEDGPTKLSGSSPSERTQRNASLVGRTLGHYKIEAQLGAGGMGVLYRAMDLKLGRAVAIKLLAQHLVDDETAKARFVREARAASALDHPNIGTVHDICDEDGELFIVMALYDGQTLREYLKKGRVSVAGAQSRSTDLEGQRGDHPLFRSPE
jgi:hypothetical protein